MDFLDPKKKRAHNIRLLVGYVLMGIALMIATFILVFEASGFDYDRKTNTVIQNGLLFIDASPEPANIYLNGEPKGKTDNRLVMPSGDYKLELKQDGYRTWMHNFTLEGSSIERFIYPFLFPTKLVSKDLQLYATQPGLSTESPDRKWLLVQHPATLNDFDLLTLDNKTDDVAAITVPTTVLANGPGINSLQLVEWSTDNRHVLVKHTFEGGSEFVIIDRESPAESINITKTFPGETFTAVKLRDKKYDQLYLYNQDGGILKTAEVKSKLVTPLLASVLAFQPHEADTIMYVTTANEPADKVAVRIRDGLDTYNVRELPVSANYVVDLARFDGHWYFGIGASSENRVYIYKDGFDALKKDKANLPAPFLALSVPNPQHISFSANARFISVQGGSSFGVYDAENNRAFNYDTKLPQADSQKATWMDGHRLMLVSDSKLTIFDFDNTNRQSLVTMTPGTLPFFNRDYTALYTISPSATVPDKPALLRTELKINK